MDKIRNIIALEFSGSQVKGAAAECNFTPFAPVAIPTIVAIASVDKADCVRYGRVQNIIDAQMHATQVLRKLENVPALQGGSVTGAYVGVSGRSLGSMRASAELVLPSQMTVDNDIVAKLMSEATKAVPGDKVVLKVLPRKYMVDNQICLNPVGELGSTIKGEFTVVTCNPANKSNIERVVAQGMGLEVMGYICTPLAIADLVLGEEEKQRGCILIDLGAQTTTVSVYKDRALQLLVTLPMGSHNVTLDIANGLKTTVERAEQAKCTQADAAVVVTSQASDDTALINCYVQARMGEIIANVMHQVSLAGFKAADLPAGIVLTGRGSKLAGLAKMVEDQTKMDQANKMKVRSASVGAAVKIDDPAIVPTDFTSLISIVAAAAADGSTESCMEFPDKEDEQAEDGFEFVSVDSTSGAPVADAAAAEDNDDWMKDDEQIEAENTKNNLKAQRDAQKKADADARAEAKAKREADRLARKQAEAEEKARKLAEKQAQKEAQIAENANKPTLLEKLKDKLEKMVSYNPNNNDTPID